jgi:hypothetical protein
MDVSAIYAMFNLQSDYMFCLTNSANERTRLVRWAELASVRHVASSINHKFQVEVDMLQNCSQNINRNRWHGGNSEKRVLFQGSISSNVY